MTTSLPRIAIDEHGAPSCQPLVDASLVSKVAAREQEAKQPGIARQLE